MTTNPAATLPLPPPAALVRQLAGWLRETDIATLELHGPGLQLRLQRGAAPAEPGGPPDGTPDGRTPGGPAPDQPTPAGPAPRLHADAPPPAADPLVRAGSVGVLRQAHPLRDEPLVRPGDAVAEGQVLALLQIGAVLLPVPAPRAGVLRRWLREDGDTVGYGDPLIELD